MSNIVWKIKSFEELTTSELYEIIKEAFLDLMKVAEECKCTYRMAAYIIAIRRLIYAEKIKGIFP